MENTDLIEQVINELKSRLSISVENTYESGGESLEVKLLLDGAEISSDYVTISTDTDY